MFKGRYDHVLDGKGRASLPARFREHIAGYDDDRVVLTFSLDAQHPHVDVYSYNAWKEFEKKLAAKPMFDPNVELLKRLYVANAIECLIDGHGRILIPQAHRDHAGIGKEVVWLGMNRTIELWQPERWQAAEEDAKRRIQDVRAGLAGLEL